MTFSFNLYKKTFVFYLTLIKTTARKFYCVGVIILIGGLLESCQSPLQRAEGSALGTSYRLIYASDSLIGIEDIFKGMNTSMSTYLPTSDISLINRGVDSVIVNAHFQAVFRQAKQVWIKTKGIFDPTIGQLVNAWGFGKSPHPTHLNTLQVDSLLRFTGFDKVSLSNERRVTKTSPYIFLDFNALAKGYCVDLVARRLESRGVMNYLVEIGGELVARGHHPSSDKRWIVGIDNPKSSTISKRKFIDKVYLVNRAMATSGSYRKLQEDSETGQLYTHIIDPRTGYPERSATISATVLAPTCMEADAYATAFMMMSITDIKDLLATESQLQVYLVRYVGNQIETYVSEGFKSIIIK